MDKKKILVVDDEPDFLAVIKARLQANNYEVVCATNGVEGLKAIEQERPDAVLLDIAMPKLDGLQALKKIRKKDKHLPVFMVTAFSDEERFKQARKFGASGFIVKTASLQKELQNINSALRMADKYRGGK